jgi:hypothetical protein
MTFSDYAEKMKIEAEKLDDPNLSQLEREYLSLVKLNYQRFSRILRTYKVDDSLVEKIKNISSPQIWMIISEVSCGDSAQNVPYIARIAEINPLIHLKIILRDSNLDIMDLYLTDGKSRSIPKLVAFDENGNELFQWGARPREAQELVNRLRSEGMSKEKFLEQLHLWYGRDRGKSLEQEFKEISMIEEISLH